MDGERLDVIVAGAGRVGLSAARSLDDYDHDVTVVEEDPVRCEDVSDAYVATVVEGDATRPSVLRQAGVEGADVIAGLTGNGGVNLGVCHVAQRLAEDDLRTVARIHHEGEDELEGIVDQVIYPERLGSLAAVNAVVGADVRAIEGVTGDLRILEIRVRDGAPVAGKRLDEISLPEGSVVVSTADMNHIPANDTVLKAEESYVVATEPDVADEVLNLMRG